MRLANLVTCIEQTPLYAAAICTKITPYVAIHYILRGEPELGSVSLQEWLGH